MLFQEDRNQNITCCQTTVKVKLYRFCHWTDKLTDRANCLINPLRPCIWPYLSLKSSSLIASKAHQVAHHIYSIVGHSHTTGFNFQTYILLQCKQRKVVPFLRSGHIYFYNKSMVVETTPGSHLSVASCPGLLTQQLSFAQVQQTLEWEGMYGYEAKVQLSKPLA